ncbi:MAG TPA: response regulator [Polyangiaceae bacterium]
MRQTARILIVEGDAILARDLEASLSAMGYVVTGVASSGEEAVQLASQNKPDLVLMDVMFEGEMDGIETAQRLRDRHDLPVIYLAAEGDEATFERAKQTLPLAYVFKPFDAKELGLTIRTSLERRRLETELEAAEQRFTALMDAVHDGVVMTDVDGAVTFVNRVALALSQYRPSEITGIDWTQLLSPIDASPRSRRSMARNPKSSERTAELVAKDGTRTLVRYESAPIVDTKGNVIGVIFAFRS